MCLSSLGVTTVQYGVHTYIHMLFYFYCFIWGACTPYVCVCLRHDSNIISNMNACMMCILISQDRKCLLIQLNHNLQYYRQSSHKSQSTSPSAPPPFISTGADSQQSTNAHVTAISLDPARFVQPAHYESEGHPPTHRISSYVLLNEGPVAP